MYSFTLRFSSFISASLISSTTMRSLLFDRIITRTFFGTYRTRVFFGPHFPEITRLVVKTEWAPENTFFETGRYRAQYFPIWKSSQRTLYVCLIEPPQRHVEIAAKKKSLDAFISLRVDSEYMVP